MSTTVRVRREDKAALDRLQAKITLREGERVPLEEVLHRLVELGKRREDEIVGDRGPQLTEEEKQRILDLPTDFGIRTSEATIDEELYGLEREDLR